jgi:hypothetical protein
MCQQVVLALSFLIIRVKLACAGQLKSHLFPTFANFVPSSQHHHDDSTTIDSNLSSVQETQKVTRNDASIAEKKWLSSSFCRGVRHAAPERTG